MVIWPSQSDRANAMSDFYWIDKAQKELSRNIADLAAAQKKDHAQLLTAFNRVAAALEGIRDEIREMREEMNPKLDKVRLPPPGGAGRLKNNVR
jgi:hypothetical protein